MSQKKLEERVCTEWAMQGQVANTVAYPTKMIIRTQASDVLVSPVEKKGQSLVPTGGTVSEGRVRDSLQKQKNCQQFSAPLSMASF